MDTERLEKTLQGDEWLGHPLHPALVALPIGAWMFGALMDGIASATRNKCAQDAADHAAFVGLVGAASAAVAGLAEFMRVPSDEKAQQTALTHATLNVSAVALYSMNSLLRYFRRGRGKTGGFIPKMLSLAGVGIIGYSGWLGGSLVYRHGTAVSVEHGVTLQGKPEEQPAEAQPRMRRTRASL
ncbi:MAG: DUF2231 domain-containing protein [Armatimonadota bacterium]|nr:DUF2231 domain-containing protein [bacterium]